MPVDAVVVGHDELYAAAADVDAQGFVPAQVLGLPNTLVDEFRLIVA